MSQEYSGKNRFIVIDRFLLQAVESYQRYKIVNLKYALRIMTEAQKKEFEKADLIDIDEYVTHETDLFDSSSKMLFEFILPEEKHFYVDSETGATKVVASRTASAYRKSSVAESVITITFRNNKKKFLRYNKALSAPTFTNPQDLFTGSLETDNSLTHLDFDIESVAFTKADSEIMKVCYLSIGFYQQLCEKLIMRCYDVAQAQGNRSVMVMDRTGATRPMIKKFHRPTLKQYGHSIVPYVFMLLHIARLSTFASYRKEEGFTEIDSKRLLQDATGDSPEDIDVTYWSQLCVDMLLGKDTLGRVLQTLVRCCAIEFENGNLHERRQAKNARQIRKSMDAFKAFLIFCSMCTADGHELFEENGGCQNWKWIKHLYAKTAQAEVMVDQYSFTVVPESHGVRVRGKLFNRQYIRDFHFECRSRVESLIDKLNEYFIMPSVEDIACLVLRNRSVSFSEPWPDMCSSNASSFYDLIPKLYQSEVMPKVREGKFASEATKATVEFVVNEVARLLMWMVYFGVGHPYRFPELRQMALAGYQRNVFVDDTTRRLQLYSNYSKNKSSNFILKTMDNVTSEYMFYFIVVLKQLQFWALSPVYKNVNISVESGLLNDTASPEVKSQRALRSYLFLDTTKGDLIRRESFSKLLNTLPKGERTRLNLRELRQAMCGVIRHYCNMTLQEQTDLYESLVHELMASHSILTAFENYAVNKFTMSSLTASGPQNLQMRASARYISWVGLEDAPGGERQPSTESLTKTVDKKFMVSSEYKRYEDLEHAGRKAFGPDFAFRDEKQRSVTTDIYMGELPSRVVQAPTGYGKTELFRLPLIALASKKNCKHVSFVFVPYTVILADAMRRLKTRDLLRVNDVKLFIANGYDGVTDVYVGVFDDLSQTQFASRIAEWDCANSRRPGETPIKLGYAILDEFHNFYLEKYRKPQFEPIKRLNFDGFKKILFLSATAPVGLADAALRAIGFVGVEKPINSANEMLMAEKQCLKGIRGCYTPMTDLVAKVPLGHVHKEFRQIANPYQEAFKLLKGLFRSEPRAKAVVLTSSRHMVQWLATEWELDFNIVWIHGELETDEKVKRAESFIQDESKRILLGTKLATEGIDVRELKMVIMIDYQPSVIEFLQAGGRMRSSGMFYILLDSKNNRKKYDSDQMPMTISCPSAQIAQFYGFRLDSDAQHHACCGISDSLPQSTRQLVLWVNAEAKKLVYETTKQREERLSTKKRKAPDNPSLRYRKNILYSRFHKSGQYISIWYHLEFGKATADCLKLNGIQYHFWPTGTLIEKGRCDGCMKQLDLCVCSKASTSYRQIACEAFAVRRMLMDDNAFKIHLENMTSFLQDPTGYITKFDDDKKAIYHTVRQKTQWFEDLISSKFFVAAECVGAETSCVFKLSAKQIETNYFDRWKYLKEQKTEPLEFFWRWSSDKCPDVWEKDWRRETTSYATILEKHDTFARLHEGSNAGYHGPHYVKTQFYKVHDEYSKLYQRWKTRKAEWFFQPSWDMFLSMVIGTFFNERLKSRVSDLVAQVGAVRLLPHWMKLQWVEVKMADGVNVPFFVLCLAIHQEMENS